MLLIMCTSKLHRVRVTECLPDYPGSIGIDEALLDAADILLGQQVDVINLNTGSRHQTYVISQERGSGIISLNGAGARLAQVGDELFILAYRLMDESAARQSVVRTVFVDSHNAIR